MKNIFKKSSNFITTKYFTFSHSCRKILSKVSSSNFFENIQKKNWEKKREKVEDRHRESKLHFLFYKVNIQLAHTCVGTCVCVCLCDVCEFCVCVSVCVCVCVPLFSFLCLSVSLSRSHTHTELYFRTVSLTGDKNQTRTKICEFTFSRVCVCEGPLQQLQLSWNEIISLSQSIFAFEVIWSSKNFPLKQYDDQFCHCN